MVELVLLSRCCKKKIKVLRIEDARIALFKEASVILEDLSGEGPRLLCVP